MSEIVLAVPGPDEPGFLRRMRVGLELSERFSSGRLTPQMVDALVEYLLPYVQQPAEREAARQALLDASQAQFEEMMRAVNGGEAAGRPFSAT